jgi:hypothetical protein
MDCKHGVSLRAARAASRGQLATDAIVDVLKLVNANNSDMHENKSGKFLHTTICIRGGTIPGLARNGPFLAAPRNVPPRMHMVVWLVICSSCRCSICSVQVLCGSCADAITECVTNS